MCLKRANTILLLWLFRQKDIPVVKAHVDGLLSSQNWQVEK
jgi:hypothetical protein